MRINITNNIYVWIIVLSGISVIIAGQLNNHSAGTVLLSIELAACIFWCVDRWW